jgi:hypothetical protein
MGRLAWSQMRIGRRLTCPGNWPGSRPSCWPGATGAAPPRGSRALTCFWQAVLGLRWFRDHGISRATAYRYLDEVIAVLADQAGPAQSPRNGPKTRTCPM